MGKPLQTILLIAGLTCAVGRAEHRQPLVVQDVNASFVDVAARRKELATTTNPRVLATLHTVKSCTGMQAPMPPPDSLHIPGHYLSGSHGPTDPREYEAAQPFYRIQEMTAQGADSYVARGDAREAECVLDALDPWAKARAMTGYSAHEERQFWYHAEWTVASVALSVSVIRQEPSLDQAKLKRVINWLNHAARKLKTEEDLLDATPSHHNNHHYWRGLAYTAVGVISKDDFLFRSGLSIYGEAIDALNPEGAFPAEMARHELAIHYQAFALEPLVMIAQLAWRQGYNIYATPAHGETIANGIDFLRRALGDPSIVAKYAADKQELIDLGKGEQLLAWVEIWNQHAGKDAWGDALGKPYFIPRLGGNMTLDFAVARQ